MSRIRSRWLAATVAAAVLVALAPAPPAAAAGPNLAAGRPAAASSHNDVYVAGNVTDGNQNTYWESANNAFPQWVQVDLGAAAPVNEVTLRLPASWGARTQTLTVTGSADGAQFSTLAASAGRQFAPSVTIAFAAATVRYVRVTVTANTGWPAAQISEFEVYGTGGDPGPGPDPSGGNLALNKPITASGVTHTFVAANAVDGNVATYWEGPNPSTLTVQLGANAALTGVRVRLNPDPAWGARVQTFEIAGRAQGATAWTTIKASASYSFSPSSGNTVTVPVGATAADVQLRFTGNTGAPGGQVAELEVLGAAAPGPDLTVTAATAAPSAPVETDPITLSATVRNAGTQSAPASSVTFYLGTTRVGTAAVGALAAGASATVSAGAGTRAAGSYQLIARVDEANAVAEQNETNNAFTAAAPLVVRPSDTADLVPTVSWSPGTPSAGQTATFTVTVRNQGTVASTGGPHAVTVTVLNGTGGVVRTLTGTVPGIAAGASAQASVGTWAVANGRYTVRVTVAAAANELASRRGDNTAEIPFFAGRGADMPFDMYEAEDGATGGGAGVVGPNRTVGDLAGEASGRRAVTLNSTGAYVQWTTRAATNTLVTRFSIPDGTTSSLSIYVNGAFHKSIPLTSKFAWLYGAESSPTNSPGSGAPRHIYDEANIMLNSSVPAGSTIRLQKDAGNPGPIAVDFASLEQVAPIGNPDAARYVVPDGFTHQAVQNALDTARQDTGKLGVYLPAGTYETNTKFQVYGRSLRIVGAGPWYTRFQAPQSQENTDVGFRADATANGTVFSGFAYFGNYTTRIDGPGKVFDLQNVANMTIENVWAEHQVCLYWGTNTDNMVIRNSRARNLFADAINMTNGSTGNRVSNVESRASGDDSFALFSAIDAGGGDVRDNVYENLTSILTWRAAGVAVYGGLNNVFRNIYIADTLVYSGITISSLDFGYPMNGFGANPPTTFDNISIVRAGGHFWGNQTFPAIWVFSASKVFQGIRVSNVDIVDPTYSGIMFQTNYDGAGRPQNPVTDTVFTNVSISGARKSGDAWDAKSGFGIWVNELPEPGQGPAVGSAVFNNLTLSNNAVDIRNTTSTFTIVRN
ncbi:discoidin domain-containing protein [Spirilliplanes yamanashiensis]|uniref:F5/8 type C domain-containing protein n=1 Tax=Spirilliplanes yamanashiensis TaxID=42233 RepID=A0A8J4DJ70_9ACTN|nr:CARDB domain-containing protein [Spirilliplanes yamanashiensis]MDP9815613.1 hypothetical protein [Spirilliplanes yamanashiensis]GIJ03867.1 hypothetical protein Sya03_32190 [Spirilliplanes yamanashiensis]